MLLLLFLALSVIVGYMQGGNVSNLSQVKTRYGSLVLLAVAIKFILFLFGYRFDGSAPVLAIMAHMLSYLLVAVFLFANLKIEGMSIVALGLLLNFVVILSSGLFAQSTAFSKIFSLPFKIPFNDAFSAGTAVIGFGMFIVISKAMQARKTAALPMKGYQPKHLAGADKAEPVERKAV